MPYGDLEATIMPRFVDPGNEIPEGGLVAPMPGKVINLNVIIRFALCQTHIRYY